MNSVQRYSEQDGIAIDVFSDAKTILQSDLNDRFDCNYRSPEYFKLMKELTEHCEKQGWELKRIGRIEKLKINVGSTPRGSESFSPTPEVPFVKTKNVYKGYLKTDNLSFLTEEAYEKHKSDSVIDGNILLTIIGANFKVVGRAYVFDYGDLEEIETKEANINQNIARLSEIPDDYDINFFENFLNSHLGQVQIRRFSKQSVQVNLSTNEVKCISIPKLPKPSQERLSKIVSQGRKQSQRIKLECDFQIKQMDSDILNLAGVVLSETSARSFQTEISDQLNVNFYNPKYLKLLEDLEKQERLGKIQISKLGNLAPRIVRNCTLDEDEIYRYVELGDVDARTGKITSFDEISGDNPPSRAKWEIKENDLLVPALRGSSKNLAVVDRDFDGCIASSGFVVFSTEKEDMRYYLLAVLRSPIIQLQYEQRATGSIMSDVQTGVLADFIVPVPKDHNIFLSLSEKIKKTMTRITKFYDEAERLLTKTESLFDEVILGKLAIEQAEDQFSQIVF
jgi:restriction endonuclease S subunit